MKANRKVTQELQLRFDQGSSSNAAFAKKAAVVEWLSKRGWAFVEGFVDGVEFEIDATSDEAESKNPFTAGQDLSPVVIFGDSKKEVQAYWNEIQAAFPIGVVAHFSEIPADAWQNCWEEEVPTFTTKKFFVGPQKTIRTMPLESTREFLMIDAVESFGTGQHATTRACLEMLEELPSPNASQRHSRVLDVGTGTGILAIAAAKLGYKEVVGTDIADSILEEAKANCAVNQVHVRLSLGERLSKDLGVFDVIMANILVPVLHELFSEMVEVLAPGGHLLLAGFIAKEVPLLQKRWEALGLNLKHQHVVRGWLCLVLTKVSTMHSE